MKIVSVILGIALVLLGAAAIHLSREVEAGRQQIADLTAQLQARDAQPAAPAVTPVSVPAASVPATAPPAPTPTVESAASTATSAVLPALLADTAALRAQRSSPEATAQRRQIGRMLMESTNPNVGEALGLTPDEEGKLLELLAAHQDGMSAVFSAAADGGPATPQERSAALQQRQQANQAELQAMLGSKYPQWEDYQQTRPAWQQLRDLRAVADAAGTPLTDGQAKSLIAALSIEERNFRQQSRDAAIIAASQGTRTSEILVRHSPERRQQMLDVAAAHLSPQQLEGYRGMLERAAAQEERNLSTLRRAEATAAAAAAAPQLQ